MEQNNSLNELNEFIRKYYEIVINQAERKELPILETVSFKEIKILFSFCINEIEQYLEEDINININIPEKLKLYYKDLTKAQLEELVDFINQVVRIIKSKDVYHYVYSKNNINEQVSYFKNKKDEINKIASSAKQLIVNHALSGFKDLYKNEADRQCRASRNWLNCAVIFALILILAIAACFYFNYSYGSLQPISLIVYANEVTFNLVLLSITLWSARMYWINKSLEINYRHKSISADALVSFIDVVKDDKETKNNILLESSRMILALPETGLNKKDSQIDNKLLETIRDVSTMTKKA